MQKIKNAARIVTGVISGLISVLIFTAITWVLFFERTPNSFINWDGITAAIFAGIIFGLISFICIQPLRFLSHLKRTLK